MNKNQKQGIWLFCFFSICLMMGIGTYMGKREACAKNVCGLWARYTYYDRNLSVSDFAQFGYDMTYEDLVAQLGMPNGIVANSSTALPYYELNDKRFVVCGCFQRRRIFVANDKDIEYYLLTPKLLKKSETIKKREVASAKQFEMNLVLWMLGIKDWKYSFEEPEEEPMGEYAVEKLKQYTDRDISIECSYYFGRYHESRILPLIQLIWIFEGQKPICFGYVVWDTNSGMLLAVEDDAEYIDVGSDWIVKAGKWELKGQKEVLDIDGKDTDLESVLLSPNELANSLTEFLIKQKVIRNRRNMCVEFWGDDGNGNGNYVCLLMTNVWQKGWGIDADSKMTQYYLVAMDTVDNRVASMKVMRLERDL